FVAVLMDRLRISMRICALAAMVVLVLDPASLVGVSFQMSFGAVVALIAVYEKWGAQLAHLFHRGGFGRKALGYCGAVAVTTVVATIGTEPFAIYHFHHLVLYSPLANVIAVPISAMWTLPWGVVAFGRFLAARTPEGDYRIAAGAEKIHRSFLVSETGGRLLPWPGRGDPAADGLDCAGEARCSYTAYGRRVAIVTAESGLQVSSDTVH